MSEQKPADRIATLKETLDSHFPHGHPAFNELMLRHMSLHSSKTTDYASTGDPLGNFDRVARIMSLYPYIPPTPLAVAIMYTMKHFDRILWALNKEELPSDEALGDIVVYITIMRCMLQ